MKGESNVIVKLVVLAIGIKVLTFLGGNYVNAVDASGNFSDMIKGLLGVADMIFYGIIVIIVLLIPYYLSKRKKGDKRAIPDRPRPVERERHPAARHRGDEEV